MRQRVWTKYVFRLSDSFEFVVCYVFLMPPPETDTWHEDGDPLGLFSVEAVGEEWRVILKGALDREAQEKHSLRVVATDGRSQDTATVDVHVLDINDNSPLCEQVSLSYVVLCSAPLLLCEDTPFNTQHRNPYSSTTICPPVWWEELRVSTPVLPFECK